MKRLYLLRHAKAEANSADGLDSSRRLTLRGEERLAEKMPIWQDRLSKVALILTSPVVRALQTTKVVAGFLGKEDMITEKAFLQAGSLPDHVAFGLAKFDGVEEVLVVGHNPWISELVLLLIKDSGMTEYHLKTAALAHIIFDHGFGVGQGRLVEII